MNFEFSGIQSHTLPKKQPSKKDWNKHNTIKGNISFLKRQDTTLVDTFFLDEDARRWLIYVSILNLSKKESQRSAKE